MHTLRGFPGILALGCLAVLSARADLISYEPANYTPTDSIVGLNGGTGWAQAWTGANNVAAGGLSYPGVVANGNRLTTDGNGTGSFRVFATTGHPELTTADGRYGKEGTVLWFSYLTQRQSTTALNTFAGLSLWNGAVRQAFFGALRDRAFWGASVDALGAAGNVNSTLKITNDSTVLVVVRFSFGVAGTNDRMEMFLNPTAGTEPSSASADVSLSGFDLKFDRLLINSGDTATVAAFDELRFGTTYADVVPASQENPAPKLQWLREIGGDRPALSDSDGSLVTLVNGLNGDVVVGGSLDSRGNFGTLNALRTGSHDGFVVALDADLTQVRWAQSIASESNIDTSDSVNALARDGFGNLVVGGRIDTPPTLGLPAITNDTFLARLRADGTSEWGVAIDTLGRTCVISSVAIGADGLIYACGTIAHDPEVDNSVSAKFGTLTLSHAKGWVACLTRDGTFLWVAPAGDSARAVAVDKFGNVVVAGYFIRKSVIGSETYTSTDALGTDAYLTRMDPNGTTLWTRVTAKSGNERSSAVAIGPNGEAYWALTFPGNGVLAGVNVSNAGNSLVAQLDAAGHLVWTTAATAPFSGFVESLTVSEENALYAGGRLQSPTVGGLSVPNAFGGPFVVNLNAQGKPVWLFGATADSGGSVACLNIAPNGDLLFGGTYEGVMTFGAAQISTLSFSASRGFVGRITAGAAPVDPTPIAITERPTETGVHLSLTGPCCIPIAVKSSVNLRDWDSFWTGPTVKNQPIELDVPFSAGQTSRFFRIRRGTAAP